MLWLTCGKRDLFLLFLFTQYHLIFVLIPYSYKTSSLPGSAEYMVCSALLARSVPYTLLIRNAAREGPGIMMGKSIKRGKINLIDFFTKIFEVCIVIHKCQ